MSLHEAKQGVPAGAASAGWDRQVDVTLDGVAAKREFLSAAKSIPCSCLVDSNLSINKQNAFVYTLTVIEEY